MQKTPLLIIGQGPAGLSAAIYAARAGIHTVVLGNAPKIAADHLIDNYFGFPETITGTELIARGVKQAERFGAKLLNERVLSAHMTENGHYHIKTEQEDYETCSLILATGVDRVKPRISNFKEYEGRGISYCVSCDGFFFRNKNVMVLGEGNYAAHQATELLNYTPHIKVFTQGKPVTMSQPFLQKLEESGIPIIADQKIVKLKGDNTLQAVELEDGSEKEMDGIFVAIGQARSSDFASTLGLEMQDEFVSVDERQKTNLPGVFAAGDCVGRYQQISVAVGEGAIAAHAAIEHVKKHCSHTSSPTDSSSTTSTAAASTVST